MDPGLRRADDFGLARERADPLPGTTTEFPPHRLIPVLNDPAQIEAWRTAPLPHRGRGRGPARQGWEGEGLYAADTLTRPSLTRRAPSPAMREREIEQHRLAI